MATRAEKLAQKLKPLLTIGFVPKAVPAEDDTVDAAVEVHGPDGDTGFHLSVPERGPVMVAHFDGEVLTDYGVMLDQAACQKLAELVVERFGEMI